MFVDEKRFGEPRWQEDRNVSWRAMYVLLTCLTISFFCFCVWFSYWWKFTPAPMWSGLGKISAFLGIVVFLADLYFESNE